VSDHRKHLADDLDEEADRERLVACVLGAGSLSNLLHVMPLARSANRKAALAHELRSAAEEGGDQ
jgi:hypothetical protein